MVLKDTECCGAVIAVFVANLSSYTEIKLRSTIFVMLFAPCIVTTFFLKTGSKHVHVEDTVKN